jgi:hypothetical protein
LSVTAVISGKHLAALNWFRYIIKVKGKGVPLHAMEAHGGERWYGSYSYLTSATRWGWVVSVTPRPRVKWIMWREPSKLKTHFNSNRNGKIRMFKFLRHPWKVSKAPLLGATVLGE